MNSFLETALGLVVRDLESTGGITLQVSDAPIDNDPTYESVWLLSPDGSATGLLAYYDLPEAERLVDVVDHIQEFVHEELASRLLPATWPECPEHPMSHPLTPALTANIPSWQCPNSGNTIAPIGNLT